MQGGRGVGGGQEEDEGEEGEEKVCIPLGPLRPASLRMRP
jgi:hypothetical protein